MAYETNFILEGIMMIGLIGLISSIVIHVLDTITTPGYVPKKERIRRAKLLEAKKK